MLPQEMNYSNSLNDMKFFAACSTADPTNDEVLACISKNPKKILVSFFYENNPDHIKKLLAQGVEVFIDSGAFSAHNSGKMIDIDDYCRFLLESSATLYAGLDVIGDAEATQKNQEYMETKYGLQPIPTFHMGSRLEDLQSLLKYSYIALGGLVFAPGKENHLDETWRQILNANPQMRVHGFGLTNIKLMERYPWYSVDSSSFKGCKRFGRQSLYEQGFSFRDISEDEFIEFLVDEYRYKKEELKNDGHLRRYLEDLFAVNSMKEYVNFVSLLHQYKDFSFLTNQQSLL